MKKFLMFIKKYEKTVFHLTIQSRIIHKKKIYVFVDNFFTNIPLVKYLLQKGTNITGTIKTIKKNKSRKELKKTDVDIPKYFIHDEILMRVYREKKIIIASRSTNFYKKYSRKCYGYKKARNTRN